MGSEMCIRDSPMTDAQKEQVRYLRCEGLGYGAIATRLGISENTVKSFCRRNNLTGVASKEPVVVCRNCGRPLPQYSKRKQRKFCSEACRQASEQNFLCFLLEY